MISSPWSTHFFEFRNGSLGVLFKIFSEFTWNWQVFIIELSEEDKTDILIQVEWNIWIVFLDSFQFNDKFFNQQAQGKFVSKGFGIFSRYEDGSVDLFLNDFLLWNANNSLHWS